MLIIGTLFMGFWLFLVGGLQARFGHWGIIDGSRAFINPMTFTVDFIVSCRRHLGC